MPLPSREQMIKELAEHQAAKSGQAGSQAISREQMIQELAQHHAKKNEISDPTAYAVTGIRSALENVTLGASEPVYSGINAVTNTLYNAAANDGELSFKELGRQYDQDVEQRRQLKAQLPMTDIVGQSLGAVAPVGPANALAKASTQAVEQVVPKVIGSLSKEVSGFFPNATQSVGRVGVAAAQGSAAGLADRAARNATLMPTGFVKEGETPSYAESAIAGAAFGGGITGALEAAKASLPVAGSIGKKAISVFLGPSGKSIDEYLANPQRIREAKSIEDIKTEVDAAMSRINDDLQAKKLSLNDAKEAQKLLQQQYREAQQEAGQEFQTMKFGFQTQQRDIQNKLKDNVQAKKEQLQSTTAPLVIAQDVQDGIRKLQQDVNEGSKKSYQILDNTHGEVDLSSKLESLYAARNSLNVRGADMPATPQAAQAQAEIDKILKHVGKLPGKISFSAAKQIIQQIDAAEKVVYQAGVYTDDVGKAFEQLRRGLDADLKQIPAYKAQMEEVAQKTGLLKRLTDRHGDITATRSTISGLHRPVAKESYDDLVALGSVTGKGFVRDIDEYVKAQQTLSNPQAMRKLERSQPEYKEARALSIRNERLKHPRAKDEFVNEKTNSYLPKLEEGQAKIQALQDEFDRMIAETNKFKGLTENTSQGKINNIATRQPDKANIQTIKQLSALGKREGQDFIGDIRARRTANDFEKSYTNGSRNVLIGAVFGSLIGGPMGTAVGGAVGASVDKFGPAVGKKVLDGFIAARGTKTAQAAMDVIHALDIPPEAKSHLIQGIVKAQSGAKVDPSKIKIGESEEKKGEEKWANDGINKAIEAKPELSQFKGALLSDPKAKQILIELSDLAPGSKAFVSRLEKLSQIKKGKS